MLFQDSDIDKMEKAEILEKTLEVLTRFRREYNTASFSSCSSSTSALHSSPSARQVMAVRYASGFSSCAEESIRYIQSSRLVPAEVKAQLQNHLRSIARRMENRVVDVEAVPAVSPATVQFPHPYSVNQYSTPTSAVYPRGVSTPLAGAGDLVSSSMPSEAESISGFRIPSPIHSSTPLTTHPYPYNQDNMSIKPSTLTNEVPHSFQASRRYECITPEIDVVAEAEDTRSETTELSQSHTFRQQIHHPLPPTADLAKPMPLNHSISSRFPVTSTPVYSCQQQTFSTSSLSYKKGLPQPPHSSQSSVYPICPQPHRTSSSPSPHSAFSSPISPSSSQTIYTYHGYEPLPTTSVSTDATARQCLHPLSTSANNTLSSPESLRPANSGKPQVTPSTPALDLCVKRHGSHQISPETMWRPWWLRN